MNADERTIDRTGPAGQSSPGSAEPSVRPISSSLRRRSVALTAAQSDVLATLLVPGARRLVELLSFRNGTICATVRGGGYAALKLFVNPDGRVVVNEDASQSDPFGDETEPFVVARESDRLHLGTLLPRAGERSTEGGDGARPAGPTPDAEGMK